MANSPKSAASGSATSGSGSAGSGSASGSRRSIEDLESDIDRLRQDIAQLTRHLKDTGRHSIRGAKRAATEGAEQLRAQGEAAMEDWEARIEGRVREKPITSLAIAAAVGYVLAIITRR